MVAGGNVASGIAGVLTPPLWLNYHLRFSFWVAALVFAFRSLVLSSAPPLPGFAIAFPSLRAVALGVQVLLPHSPLGIALHEVHPMLSKFVGHPAVVYTVNLFAHASTWCLQQAAGAGFDIVYPHRGPARMCVGVAR